MAITTVNSPLPKENPALLTPSKCADAFRAISRGLLYSGLALDLESQYAHLRTLFGFDKLQSDLLSLLLTRRVGFHNQLQARHFLPSTSEAEIRKTWSNLQKAGFVCYQTDPRTNERGLSIRSAFAIAIQKDVSLDEALTTMVGEEFVDALRRVLKGTPRKAVSRKKSSTLHPIVWMDVMEQFDMKNEDGEEVEEKADETRPFSSPTGAVDNVLKKYVGTPLVRRVEKLTEGLGDNARLLLFGMMGWFTEKFVTPLTRDSLSGMVKAAFDSNIQTLLEKGLAVSLYIWEEGNKKSDTENYRIAPRVAEVFRGLEKLFNFGVLAQFGTFTSLSDIRPKDLFYCAQDLRNVQRLRSAAAPAEYERIIKALTDAGERPCLSAILYGAPGTGKTELARQIARESGRSILVVDVPKVFGIYIGEGAIRLRDLFQTYRYVCAVSRVSPILFMDEADGILGQRVTDITRAANKDANSCQSIILDELNSLPGMLIATTNLIRNLDEAMLRRFMIKAEFHLPDAETRARLWLSKFPSLSPDEAQGLAERYETSGGIIDNIVSIAIIDGILEKRPITAEDLHEYCEQQGIGRKHQKRIGF